VAGNRLGRTARGLPVQPLVGEAGEPHRALVDQVRALTLLVHRGARALSGRRDGGAGPVPITAAGYLAATRSWPLLQPPQHIPIDLNLQRRGPAAGHCPRVDRRLPGPVRRDAVILPSLV
jgi:hypothetical protein